MPEAVVNIWKSDKKAMEITLKLVTGNSIKFLCHFLLFFHVTTLGHQALQVVVPVGEIHLGL